MEKNTFKIIVFCVIFLLSLTQMTYVRAASGGQWVTDAFSAAKSFINEKPKAQWDWESKGFNTLKDIVKAVNRVLITLLAGLSMLSLTIIGVRYILAGASPEQQQIAKKNLGTLFMGMVYGFGAFIIWNIAMGFVEIIIDALA